MNDSLLSLSHFVPSINAEASGPSYTVKRLCEELDKKANVRLATLNLYQDNKNFSYYKFFPVDRPFKRLGRSAKMKQWIKDSASKKKFNLFHSHGLWMMPNIYPSKFAQNFNIPLIVSPRGTLSEWAFSNGSYVKKIFWQLYQKPALRNVACFHATALSEYEDIRSFGFSQPVAIIPNGIDIDLTPIKKNKSTDKVLLFIGRIHRKKGLDMLLPAWKKIQENFPNWSVHIYGPNEKGYRDKMIKLSKNLKLKRVFLFDPVFGQEKLGVYQKADIFILPTYSENFGMVVAEALSAGTPAIVSNGAPWSGLEEMECGWCFDINVDSLTAKLEMAMSTPSCKIHSMGLNGRRWMERDFSWNSIAEKMLETYSWVINKGAKPDWVIED